MWIVTCTINLHGISCHFQTEVERKVFAASLREARPLLDPTGSAIAGDHFFFSSTLGEQPASRAVAHQAATSHRALERRRVGVCGGGREAEQARA